MPTVKAKRSSVKSQAIKAIRTLPESSSWEDVMYRLYVRQKIDAGLDDLKGGRVHSHESVQKEFALP